MSENERVAEITMSVPESDVISQGIAVGEMQEQLQNLSLIKCQNCEKLSFVPRDGGYCSHCSYGAHVEVVVTRGTVYDHAADIADRMAELEQNTKIAEGDDDG